MPRTIGLLVLLAAFRLSAQPTVIQGPKCTGAIHGVVYALSGERTVGLRVIAFPVGVDLGALLPTAKTNRDGEYRFEHVCHGRYTVMADDPGAGYPSTSPESNEFLYRTRTRTVTLNFLHHRAELAVYLPPKAGKLLLHVFRSRTGSEIRKFSLTLRVPGQRRCPEESMDFDNNEHGKIPVPSGKGVVLLVKAEGFKEVSKSISVPSGSRTILDLSVESIK